MSNSTCLSRCYILRGARVIDPVNNFDQIADLAVADGILVAAAQVPTAPVIDLSGMVVAPGFIDMHVHLRDPGQTHKEDLCSGTHAAAAGGFTTVVAMPNTTPAIDQPEAVAQLLQRAAADAQVRVLVSAALSLGLNGKQLTDAAALKRAGAVALTDDGRCIQSPALMLQALQQARAAGLPVIDHCEDNLLAADGVVHAGAVAAALQVVGKSAASEDVIIARDIVLAELAAAPVHIQHISTASGVELIRYARHRGLAVSAEVTPHHLLLTDAAVVQHGANAKMNPPLRREHDRHALQQAVADGTITVIATDHAPHAAEEKQRGLVAAPCGIIGLESAVPLCLTELVHAGVITLPQFISCLTRGPREVLQLEQAGTLTLGMPADITVLAIESQHVLQASAFVSRSRNTPFDAWPCRGRVAATIVGGRCVFGQLPPES